ncbi:hypothetical protein BGW36DRAFT_21453 [Talaromyces proteolyticus]|uniref:BHLH domain-containing protein n=1 Tax=Talaromyces proteolyticus TaxID=1131652 RepID=A0AAD4Q4C3_9EURO|nr:uncharacterized protein BGW36DRAFT_21453 [Talaromyces proteolyticus]KAH8706014.1 hypothetical protein BGW36DRAFT_21453 [Talaromyces proteolyticus]
MMATFASFTKESSHQNDGNQHEGYWEPSPSLGLPQQNTLLFFDSSGIARQIKEHTAGRAAIDQIWKGYPQHYRELNHDPTRNLYQRAHTTFFSHSNNPAHLYLPRTGFLPSQSDAEFPLSFKHINSTRPGQEDETSPSPTPNSPLSPHREPWSGHRISKPNQRVLPVCESSKYIVDSAWMHWPAICLEDRISAQACDTHSTEKGGTQLRWGSDSAFVSDQFVPSSAHQLSHTHATDTWLGWITSIASNGKSAFGYELSDGDPELNTEEFDGNGNGNGNKHIGDPEDPASVHRVLPVIPVDMQRERRIPRKRRDFTRTGQKLDSKQLRILQEERKKEIHNISERKRREQVNKGFADLCDIVPGMDIKAHTRKQILIRTAEWLQNFLRGNEELKEQILKLQ